MLSRRLESLAVNRESSARELVGVASEAVEAWARARPKGWSGERARSDLAQGLGDLRREQGWRGTIARWSAALEGALDIAQAEGHVARELLAEELGLWRGGVDQASESPPEFWDGEPLGPGRRLPCLSSGVRRIAPDLARGETLAVHGWSPAVAEAVETLHDLGMEPHVVVSEGGADLGGRRLARRLIAHGVPVRLVYDLALVEELTAADRLWVGCEAVGAGAILTRRGTRVLLAEARRSEVPTALVTTSDELAPAGDLALPRWPEEEGWLLWEHAPQGVQLSSQCFERVPDTLPDVFLTEVGWESAAELALRALQVGAEPKLQSQ